MGQQQFKLSFTVGTKLLISVVLLLLIFVGFLNVSAILLLREDKQAYTFQTKSTEAVLAGREFSTFAQGDVDTLRLALATFDPAHPSLSPQQQDVFKSIVDNQSDVILASLDLVNRVSGEVMPIARVEHKTKFNAAKLKAEDYAVSAEWMKMLLPELLKNGYAFINLSQLDGIPAMGLIVADLGFQGDRLPVAIGVQSLQSLESELAGLNLTVATRSGWVIFDSDKAQLYAHKNIADDPLFDAAVNHRVSGGTSDFEISGKRYLGSFFKPGLDLVVLSREEWARANRATYALVEKFILLGIMAVGAGIAFAIFFSKTLTAPINRLYEATQVVSQGNFDLNLEINSTDEIGALTESFNSMSRKIQELFVAQKEKLLLEQEISIASTVQQTLIPPQAYDSDGFSVRSFYWPASQCGGDWWGVFRAGNRVCLAIADATGHGLPSALITASARSCYSVLAKLAEEDPEFSFSPSAMLDVANRVIYDAAAGKINMTFFMAVIDLDARTLSYSNAGHNPPWLYRKEGAGRKLISLTAVGQRLGEAPTVPEFEEKKVDIQPEDILFLYTDGLTEGKDEADAMYGRKRARQVIERSLEEGHEKVIWALIDDFSKFAGKKPLQDDITIAAALLLGAPQGSKTQVSEAQVTDYAQT